MKVPLADLRAQYLELKESIDTAISEVIESGQFVNGPKTQRLENEIAQICGAQFGVGVASGTDALTLSLVACGIGSGDEVITTPFTFGATTESLALVGAKPVYVDIDPCTFNIDTSQIEAKITSRTRALLPVDLYGQMANRQALHDIATRHNLRLIVDGAQAIGARQNGKRIADNTDTTTLSFYPTKNLGAFGDGGMILTNSPELVALLKSLRGHGTVGHKYQYERVGYCSRLDAIQAAALLVKLPRLEEWNNARRSNAETYRRLLADLDGTGLVLPHSEPGAEHIYHQFTIRYPRRDALQAYLRENDIATEIYYPHALHLQNAYAYLGYREGDFPEAERAAAEVLSLPVHPELTIEQLAYVAHHVRQFVTRELPNLPEKVAVLAH